MGQKTRVSKKSVIVEIFLNATKNQLQLGKNNDSRRNIFGKLLG